MQSLDIRSLSLVAVLTSLMLPLALKGMQTLTVKNAATHIWSRGAILYALGFALLATRGVTPDFLSVVVANLVLLAGFIELMSGFQIFFERPVSRRSSFSVLLIFVFPLLWFTYEHPSVGQRIFYTSIAFALVSGALAKEMLLTIFVTRATAELGRTSERQILSVVGGMLALTSALFMLRAYLFVHADSEGGFTSVQQLVLGISFISAILNNFLFASFFPLIVSDRIAEEFHASELRYRALLKALPVGVVVQSPSGALILSNPRANEMLGLNEDQLKGKTSVTSNWRTVREDGSAFSGDQHPFMLTTATLQPVKDVIMEIDRPDNGDRFWILVNTEPQFTAEGNLQEVISTFFDITAHMKIRIGLQRSEAFNFAVINSLEETVAVLDSQANIIAVNNAWKEFGLANDANSRTIVGVGVNYLQCSQLTSGATTTQGASHVAEGIAAVLAGHIPTFEHEYSCDSPTKQRWFRMGVTRLLGERSGAIVSHLDITQRKLSELAMLRSRQHLERMLQVAPVPKILCDQQGKFTFVNDAFSRTYGYSREDISDLETWRALAFPDPGYRTEVIERWTDTHSQQSSLILESDDPGQRNLEIRVRCKDGSFKTALASRALLVDEEVTEQLLVLFDITSQVESQADLRASNLEKEALLKEVHHRVKNNLQVIASLLRLEVRRSTVDDTKSVLGHMQARIQAMALLHETLYRSGVFASVDLGSYLRRLSTQAFQAMSNASSAVELEFNLGSVQIGMDQAIPCGLLVNELISNSLKHGFPLGVTGHVTVELQPMDTEQHWYLRVSDTGVGLSESFELKQKYSLGLQLVDNLARQLKGEMVITPNQNKGVAITINFRVIDPMPLVTLV